MDAAQPTPANPATPADGAAVPRAGLVLSAAGGLGRLVDAYDRMFIAGLAMLFAGLWRWLHLGVALTAAGALLLVFVVVAAARQPATAGAAPDGSEGG